MPDPLELHTGASVTISATLTLNEVVQTGSQVENHRLVPRGGTLDWLLDVDEVPHIGCKMEEPQIGSLDWDPIWEQIRGIPSRNQSREPPSWSQSMAPISWNQSGAFNLGASLECPI